MPRGDSPKTPRGDLPDVNVWLALSVAGHVHHRAAMAWWANGAAERCLFNRVTMLGLVRLLTQPRVMGDAALAAADALALWRRWADLPEVGLQADPPGLDEQLTAWAAGALPARLLTDAYLAAFARQAGLRLVSFDADFRRFDGLDWLHLHAAGR